ncbi:MAG TPA: homoserine dehydrogenase [Clostridiales bacterium]|nr:homoserine dehydrogenase [Clostridiales bacterium]
MANIGIMGHGVVGSGVVEVLTKNSSSIEKKAGQPVKIKKILDLKEFNDSPYKELFTKNPDDILEDPDVPIVVEVMGGKEPAYTYVKKAIMSGKHVVTSNKELVAQYGAELLKLAKEKDVNFLFEASVGGGIPIIRPLSECLAANEITEIIGILNGTTNYILTKMKKEGMRFEEALSDAQQKGYAERDPSDDVEGYDAARKLAILASIAYDERVDYHRIHTEGITSITKEDAIYADYMGKAIKLLAICRSLGDRLMLRVSPVMIDRLSPLANVDDVFNAIMVRGNAIGDVMFYGRGAGKLPTASAVVGDIIDAVKHLETKKKNVWSRENDDNVMDIMETETRYFVRVEYDDEDKAADAVKSIFKDCQLIMCNDQSLKNELGFVTSTAKEKELASLFEILIGHKDIKSIKNKIRIEHNL